MVYNAAMRSAVLLLSDALLRVASAEPMDAIENDELLEQVATLREDLDRLEVQLRRRVKSMNERSAHGRDGYSSATAFLKYRCRMTGGSAQRLVTEANSLADMALTAKLAAGGRLSLDQARLLIRAKQQHPEQFEQDESTLTDVVQQARFVSDARAMIAHWSQAVSDHVGRDAAFERRALFVSKTFDGMVRLDGWLDAKAGEIVMDALDSAMPPRAAEDVRSPAQRRADALVDLVSGRSRSRVPEIVVHVADERMSGTVAETQGGSVLDDAWLERLACDCTVHRVVFGPGSKPIDVGRRHRLVTGAQRRALVARDRHCRFRGCDRPARWTDAHHVVPWMKGGRTDMDNLVLLCRFHHTLVHEGGWSLTGVADHLVLRRPDGSIMAEDKSPP